MNINYLNDFQQKVEAALLEVCHSQGVLAGKMPESDDINERWKVLAPFYIADAVREVQHYPIVALSWAAFLGMAVAKEWDGQWLSRGKADYNTYYGAQGFDDMDEHILQQILGIKLDSEKANRLNDLLRRLGETTEGLIRREQIEPQSPMAFHAFARACCALFRVGAAVQLFAMGYKMEKIG